MDRTQKCGSSAGVRRVRDIECQSSAIATSRRVQYRSLMPNNLASFAIHADDVDRCRRFYEAVFHWQFEPWGPPEFYLVHTGDEGRPGIQGLLHKRREPRGVGGPNCFECTIAVDDLDAVTDAIERHGGRILMRKALVTTVGILTTFTDPEGNVLGAMAYEHEPHT
jgi:uncharacterized protein